MTQKWTERRDHYLDKISTTQRTPAHEGYLGLQRDKRYKGIHNAEISRVIQIRTEKVGSTAFARARRVLVCTSRRVSAFGDDEAPGT